MRIIYTTGVFDLLHPGHINILKQAKKLGDYLIVGLVTDELAKKYKGTYPILSYKQRLAVLKAIKYVDKVIKQSKLVTETQLAALKVDLYVKGTDWKNRTDIIKLNWLKKNKKVKFIPYT